MKEEINKEHIRIATKRKVQMLDFLTMAIDSIETEKEEF